MARTSVADIRRKQILEATLRTIAEKGVSGTTLNKIADNAGMSRGHIRHFAGNRDALLVDAAKYFYAAEENTSAILPPDIVSLEGALEYLFGEEFATSSSENAIVLALVEMARSHSEIAAVLKEAYSSTWKELAAFIIQNKPHATPSDCESVAEAVLALSLGNVFLGDFNEDTRRTERIRIAADTLLNTL